MISGSFHLPDARLARPDGLSVYVHEVIADREQRLVLRVVGIADDLDDVAADGAHIDAGAVARAAHALQTISVT